MKMGSGIIRLAKLRSLIFLFVWTGLWGGPKALLAQGRISETLQKLHQHPDQDTQRVDLMLLLSGLYSIQSYDSMLYWADAARTLADSLEYGKGLINAYRLMASSQINLAAFDRADSLARRSLAAADSLEERFLQARALTTLGHLNFVRDRYEPATASILQALALFEAEADTQGVIFCQRWLGVLYATVGQWDQSLSYHLAALERFEQRGDPLGIAGQQNNLALVYSTQGSQLQEASDSVGARKAFTQAARYAAAAVERFTEMGDQMGLALIHDNLGDLYLELARPAEALAQFALSMRYSRRSQDTATLVGALLGDARAKRMAGRTNAALRSVDALLESTYGPMTLHDAAVAHQLKAELMQERQDFASAYTHLVEAQRLAQASRGSLEERSDTRARLGAHEVRMQELALARAQQEARRARQQIGGLSVLGVLLPLGAALFLYQRWQLRQQTRALVREEQRYRQASLALAEAQLARERRLRQELQETLAMKKTLLSEQVQLLAQRQAWERELVDLIQAPNLQKTLKQGMMEAQGWEGMQMIFEEIHPRFFPQLKDRFPALSKSDIRLASLYRLQLKRSELLDFLAISPASLKTARTRLRKKLRLSPTDGLEQFLTSL